MRECPVRVCAVKIFSVDHYFFFATQEGVPEMMGFSVYKGVWMCDPR